MRLVDTFSSAAAFEGDLAVLLRGLPAGARVTTAVVTLRPFQFEEDIFANGSGEFGTTLNGTNEIDFHARRTLVSTNVHSANLFVDLGGGVYMQMTNTGVIRTPDSPADSLEMPSNGTLPNLTVTKFRLTAGATAPVITTVTVRSVPTNVSVKLGQLPAFWTYIGELATEQTSPDFANVLNAYLTTISPDKDFYNLPFTVHSDTIAHLDMMVILEYVIQQRVLPPYLPEVNVPYNFSTLPGIDDQITTVKLPRGAMPVSAEAKILGQFEATRVATDNIGEVHALLYLVEVSPACSLAQMIHFEKEVNVLGIDLPLGKTAPGLAGVNISIQANDDGKPSGTTLANASVVVGKPLPDQTVWGSATLQSAFRLLPNEHYWLILQSQTGNATWNATTRTGDASPLLCSRDSGLSWRQATVPAVQTSLAGLFRLRDMPDKFTMPVQLQIGKGSGAVRRTLDEFNPLGRIEFKFDYSAKLSEYLQGSDSGSAPCANGELLVNGDFSQPPPDDATGRFFNLNSGVLEVAVRAAPNRPVIHGDIALSDFLLNLSVERYLMVSLNDDPPRRLDCAGSTPSRTSFSDVLSVLNNQVRTSDPTNPFAFNEKQGNNDSLALRWNAPTTPNNISSLTLLPWNPSGQVEAWQVSASVARQVSRLLIPYQRRSNLIGVLLEGGDQCPASISQVVPVSEDCIYSLSFNYHLWWAAGADFRFRVDDEADNPLYEGDMRFVVHDATPQIPEEISFSGTSENRMLDCSAQTEIKLPRPVFAVRVRLNVAPPLEGDAEAATIEWFNINRVRLGRRTLQANNQLVESELTGESIQFVVITAAGNAIQLQSVKTYVNDLQAASWRVNWLGDGNQVIKTEKQDLSNLGGERSTFDFEIRLVAPPGARQAEVAFIQADEGYVALTNISFQGTSEKIRNGAFQRWEYSDETSIFSPLEWTVSAGQVQQSYPTGVELLSGLAEDSVVEQNFEVRPQAVYTLAVRLPTIIDGSVLPAARRARAEIVWLDATSKTIGQVETLLLDEPGFPTFYYHAKAPSAAAQAKIRFVQPYQGTGNLVVASVSWRGDELVQVPLLFLGESPGQLTISNLDVTYDLPESALPPGGPNAFRIMAQGALVRNLDRAVLRIENTALANPMAIGEPDVIVSPKVMFLEDQPIEVLSGVGPRFVEILHGLAQPILNIDQLAALDPNVELADIVRYDRIQLKAAAETVSDLPLPPLRLSALEDESLESLLDLPPDELATRAGQSVSDAERFQRSLRALRLLLKNDAFRGLILKNIVRLS